MINYKNDCNISKETKTFVFTKNELYKYKYIYSHETSIIIKGTVL